MVSDFLNFGDDFRRSAFLEQMAEPALQFQILFHRNLGWNLSDIGHLAVNDFIYGEQTGIFCQSADLHGELTGMTPA